MTIARSALNLYNKKMKINFYGNVLEYTKKEKYCETKDCLNITELINELGIIYGENFRNFLLGDETCFFLINGKGLMMTGGNNTPLLPDDKIDLLPFADAG